MPSELAAQMNFRIPARDYERVEQNLEQLKKETSLSRSRVVALVLAGATRETIEAGRRAVETNAA